MFLAMAKDIRVVLIKLADRLHNMRTLKYQKPERQVAIARETLDIYAPAGAPAGHIRHQVGAGGSRAALYRPGGLLQAGASWWASSARSASTSFSWSSHQLQTQADAPPASTPKSSGRPKHFYSIYRKMKTQNKTFDQIHDLIAVRVLVDTVPDCYSTLGIVHTLWTHGARALQGLHLHAQGEYVSVAAHHRRGHQRRAARQTFEVQIRTFEMHRTAEYGIAAHWRYKEGKQADDAGRQALLAAADPRLAERRARSQRIHGRAARSICSATRCSCSRPRAT